VVRTPPAAPQSGWTTGRSWRTRATSSARPKFRNRKTSSTGINRAHSRLARCSAGMGIARLALLRGSRVGRVSAADRQPRVKTGIRLPQPTTYSAPASAGLRRRAGRPDRLIQGKIGELPHISSLVLGRGARPLVAFSRSTRVAAALRLLHNRTGDIEIAELHADADGFTPGRAPARGGDRPPPEPLESQRGSCSSARTAPCSRVRATAAARATSRTMLRIRTRASASLLRIDPSREPWGSTRSDSRTLSLLL